MTLLEVVLAIAALGLVAASATTTLSYLYGAQVREQRQLAAGELAHRFILIHMDEPNEMPSQSETTAYAKDFYRYELEVAPVGLNPSPHVASALADRRNESPVSIDRLEQITVRVWLSEDSGGSSRFDSDVPNAVLVRLIDPHFINRNHDSALKFFEDEKRRNQFIQEILGAGR